MEFVPTTPPAEASEREGLSGSLLARAPVTVIVLAFNEERNLPACLESIAAWVERVIVVDSGSTDETVNVARSYGAVVESHPFENYGAQRN